MNDAFVINSVFTFGYLLLLAFKADRHERESATLLLKVFFVSVLATGAFGIVKCIGLGLCGPDRAHPVIESYLVAGAAEEALKFFILIKLLPRLRELDEPMDPIVYLGVIALGFGFHENISYFLHFTAEGQRVAAATGDLTLYRQQLGLITLARAVPGHLLFNTCAGFLLAWGFVRGEMRRWLLPAYLLAVVLHGTWNLLAWTGNGILFLAYIVLLIGGAVVAVVWAARRSPYLNRQRDLRSELGRVAGLDPGLTKRLVRVMRRATGERQAELDRQVRGLLGDPSGSPGSAIEALIDEESQSNSGASQFWVLAFGMIIAGFMGNLLIWLTLLALSLIGCGAD